MNTSTDKLEAIEAIQKKLVGKRLSYEEIYTIMSELAKDNLGDVLTTFFAASFFASELTNVVVGMFIFSPVVKLAFQSL